MKNFINKFYGIFIICLMFIFCFASILLSTDIPAKVINSTNEECFQDCFCDNCYENIEENYHYAYIEYDGKHFLLFPLV
ncbi:hypothetical protein EOM82_03555 [bacterium]|nr:hypothetical protein [bacterium]